MSNMNNIKEYNRSNIIEPINKRLANISNELDAINDILDKSNNIKDYDNYTHYCTIKSFNKNDFSNPMIFKFNIIIDENNCKYLHGPFIICLKNNSLKIEGTYKNGNLDGEYKHYYENGQICKYCFYKNGNLDGEYKRYYENGQIYVHKFYKNGEINGEYKYYNAYGQIKEHKFWKNGNVNGEYKWWYDNGRLKEHKFYKNGKLDRECKWWNNDGKLLKHKFYKNGIEIYEEEYKKEIMNSDDNNTIVGIVGFDGIAIV